MSKHKIVMTNEECFEVVNILENYVQRKNADKDLLSAYNKINVKIPSIDISKCNFILRDKKEDKNQESKIYLWDVSERETLKENI